MFGRSLCQTLVFVVGKDFIYAYFLVNVGARALIYTAVSITVILGHALFQ